MGTIKVKDENNLKNSIADFSGLIDGDITSYVQDSSSNAIVTLDQDIESVMKKIVKTVTSLDDYLESVKSEFRKVDASLASQMSSTAVSTSKETVKKSTAYQAVTSFE